MNKIFSNIPKYTKKFFYNEKGVTCILTVQSFEMNHFITEEVGYTSFLWDKTNNIKRLGLPFNDKSRCYTFKGIARLKDQDNSEPEEAKKVAFRKAYRQYMKFLRIIIKDHLDRSFSKAESYLLEVEKEIDWVNEQFLLEGEKHKER